MVASSAELPASAITLPAELVRKEQGNVYHGSNATLIQTVVLPIGAEAVSTLKPYLQHPTQSGSRFSCPQWGPHAGLLGTASIRYRPTKYLKADD